MSSSISQYTEYIPESHVRFLEQQGIKVIPISYTMEKTDLYDLLDQINGIYIHGDSLDALSV